MMKTRVSITVYAMCLLGFTCRCIGEASTEIACQYTVRLTFSRPLTAHVAADIGILGGKLSMYAFGNDNLKDGWATYVTNLTILDEAGKNVEFARSGRSEWQVAEKLHRVHVQYDVDLTPAANEWPLGNLRYAKFDGRSLFLTNRLLFMDSGQTGTRRITFEVPRDWRISSPWKQVSSRTFVADDNRDLVFNTTVLGHYSELRIEDSGFRLLLAMPAELESAATIVAQAAEKVVHSYLKLFPDTPRKTYLMTVFRGKNDDGESYYRSSAFTTSDPLVADNFILWGNFISHELFHYWNGQQIKGKDVADRQWFNEGFTEYFANKTLVKDALISDDLFIRKMENHLGMYSFFKASPVFQGISILESGKQKGYNRPGVYDGGWAVAFCLDMNIQTATNSARSIDDFMRAMYKEFGLRGMEYTVQDIAAVASETAGADQTEFFERYVKGTEALPLKACLGAAGFEGFSKDYAAEFYVFPVLHPTREQLARRSLLLHNRRVER